MCCRYYCARRGFYRVAKELDVESDSSFSCQEGEIRPDDNASIITAGNGGLAFAEAKWGFVGKQGNLIINARAETALEKPMFRASIMTRRCLIPSEKFYEWDYSKNIAEFTDAAKAVIYLAGLWYIYENIMRFTVLTVAANESVLPVHDRMPLMIAAADARRWVLDNNTFQDLLSKEMPALNVFRAQEQMRMF